MHVFVASRSHVKYGFVTAASDRTCKGRIAQTVGAHAMRGLRDWLTVLQGLLLSTKQKSKYLTSYYTCNLFRTAEKYV